MNSTPTSDEEEKIKAVAMVAAHPSFVSSATTYRPRTVVYTPGGQGQTGQSPALWEATAQSRGRPCPVEISSPRSSRVTASKLPTQSYPSTCMKQGEYRCGAYSEPYMEK